MWIVYLEWTGYPDIFLISGIPSDLAKKLSILCINSNFSSYINVRWKYIRCNLLRNVGYLAKIQSQISGIQLSGQPLPLNHPLVLGYGSVRMSEVGPDAAAPRTPARRSREDGSGGPRILLRIFPYEHCGFSDHGNFIFHIICILSNHKQNIFFVYLYLSFFIELQGIIQFDVCYGYFWFRFREKSDSSETGENKWFNKKTRDKSQSTSSVR